MPTIGTAAGSIAAVLLSYWPRPDEAVIADVLLLPVP